VAAAGPHPAPQRASRRGAVRRQAFGVRRVPAVIVTPGSRQARRWRASPLHPGQAVDLGGGHRRQARAARVRGVGVWAPHQPEPWGWATARPAPLEASVALDARRMPSEEHCRESQGWRVGVRLEWTPWRPPASVARFTRVRGVAVRLWTAGGHAVAPAPPHVRLPCQRQGSRWSLRRVGLSWVTPLAPRVSSGVRVIRTSRPPPCRCFPWWPALEGIS
jgi:hypothetical protein